MKTHNIESRIERNREIYQKFQQGQSLQQLSEAFGLTPVSIEHILKYFSEETPHWTDDLTVNARSLLLKWGKRKGFEREQLQKDYVRKHILNQTFKHRGIGVMITTEIAKLLEIECVVREI